MPGRRDGATVVLKPAKDAVVSGALGLLTGVVFAVCLPALLSRDRELERVAAPGADSTPVYDPDEVDR